MNKFEIKNIAIIGNIILDDNDEFDYANVKVTCGKTKKENVEIETTVSYDDIQEFSPCVFEYILDVEDNDEERNVRIKNYIDFYILGFDNDNWDEDTYYESELYNRCLNLYEENKNKNL